MKKLVAVAAFLLVTSCTPRGGLPNISSTTICTPGAEVPSFCVWASSVDAIVFGKLLNLTWDSSDLLSLSTGTAAAQCDGVVVEKLRMEVEVTSALKGPFVRGQSVIAYGGSTIYWNPTPYESPDNGSVMWQPAEQGLVIGQELGLVLHREPSGTRYSTVVEPLFVQDGERLRFSKQEGMCALAAPISDSSFSDVNQFHEAVEECSSESASWRDEAIASADLSNWRAFCLDRADEAPDTE